MDATPAALPARLSALLDLSRTRQALLSVAQPALGALLALGRFPSAGQVVVGLVAATTGFLAVFALNDVLDRRVDVEALKLGKAEVPDYDLDTVFVRHPLARGDLGFAVGVGWVAALAGVSAVCAYALAPLCLALFVLAVALEALYCSLRRVTWAKTFVSGLMVAVGGLAGWVAVSHVDVRAASFFAFLALWEIAGRNLPNDLSDLAADGRVGIRTVATVFGADWSARATLLGAIATVVATAALPMPAVGRVVAAGLAWWALGAPAIALVGDPTSERAAAYFNRASLLPVLVFAVVAVAATLA
jgi:4-hydroxybenzoate polyprenyltransferase